MKELYPLFGIVTVLNTPFTDDDRIDCIGLRKNVANALKAGVAGFLIPAMASEVYKLSHSERLEMVRIVLEEVNGYVPVIAGAGESDITKAREIIRTYINMGCKEVLLQIPFYNERQFRDDFMELADAGPNVIMLQDWDSGGYGLPDELILRLFEEVDAFRCLKVETVPAGVKYTRILELTGNRLNLSGGWAVSQMIEGLQRGVHAFMPTGMHPIYVQIYRDFVSGKVAESEALFQRLLPVLAFSNQHIDISIHFFKRLLYRQGVYATPKVRKPILPFDVIHERIAAHLIDYVIALEEEVAAYC